jgi:hypothetical protein
MNNRVLSKLVDNGTLLSYEYFNVEGEIGRSECRNTERVILTFPNKERLVIDTFYSSCLEDTGMEFSQED